MTSDGMAIETQVVAAVVLPGFCRGGNAPGSLDEVRQRIGILARVHMLVAEHAANTGGTACPSGTDAALARFASTADAVRAMLALVAEVEAARDADSGHHEGLLAIGLDAGPVVIGPDGQLFGVPVARAVRLAIAAEARGEVWMSDAARSGWTVAEGLGVSSVAGGALQRLDLPIQAFVVSDYRN